MTALARAKSRQYERLPQPVQRGGVARHTRHPRQASGRGCCCCPRRAGLTTEEPPPALPIAGPFRCDAIWAFGERQAHGHAALQRQRARLGGDLHIRVLSSATDRRRSPAGIQCDRSSDPGSARRRRAAPGSTRRSSRCRRCDPSTFPFARQTGLRTTSVSPPDRVRADGRGVTPASGILHDLDPSAPRVFDERELEEARHVPDRLRDFRTNRLKRRHRGVEVRNREANVIEHAPLAGLRFVTLLKDDACVSVQQRPVAWPSSHRRNAAGTTPRPSRDPAQPSECGR